MSFQAMAWACEQKVGSPTAKFVLIVLANYANDDGSCFPSQETLASDTEMSERSIRYAITALVDAGLLEVTRRPGTGAGRKSNMYTLRLPAEFAVRRRGQPAKSEGATGNICRRQPATVAEEPIKENLPLEPVKDAGSLLAAFDGVLSDEMARAVVAHRKALKKPLTVDAAKALAKQFAKTADPNAAAETMLAHGWQGFKPEWAKQDEPKPQPQKFSKPAWRF